MAHSNVIRCIFQYVSNRSQFSGNKNEMITNTRYLGVQIDGNLNWDRHIDNIKAKTNRALGIIKYSEKYLPSDVLNEMYKRNC